MPTLFYGVIYRWLSCRLHPLKLLYCPRHYHPTGRVLPRHCGAGYSIFFGRTRGRGWFPHSAHNVVLYFKLDDRPLVHCDLADVKRVC